MIQQPSEEAVARALAEALRQEPIPDDTWASLVAGFRKLEAKFPNYPEGYSTSTDAFRQARAVIALFAPILAEKERVERAPYSIGEPEGGWRNHGSFSREEKAKLRPVAETLAMLDGNAFFGNEVSAGAEWYEQYLPEAHALYEGNGGDSGWAGEASFAKPEARALAAEAALAAERKKVAQVLEPFDDVLGEDDEGYGDGLTVVMKWGACTDYSVTLADLRDVRKLAAAIRAQGE